jgi:HD-like signal output (HDOD) protein
MVPRLFLLIERYALDVETSRIWRQLARILVHDPALTARLAAVL